ncbi:hypothetical protein NliqN6_5399 [Naganishia liquefaciens]|uniref:Uncharacterized protein n=1 Tax=Naganishia liquefaciens TaxID=104408 RepID=A0A8H3TXN8_9TREE|nr:hypothetical protein NliqN6_5399 [Naganishia liquefaciens]
MFLIPSHLRASLHSVLTASADDGPHTGLLTSVQGVLYVSGSTYDPDWDESLERPDAAEDDAQDEEDEVEQEDDVEPDLSMPEWRRTLRGMANKEWKDHIEQGGKDTERVRLQCDIGKILIIPLIVPAPRISSPDTLSRRLPPDETTPLPSQEDTTGRILLVLNGKQGVRWSVLDAKADTFIKRFRTRTVDETQR